MSSIRLLRLQSDYEAVRHLAHEHPMIEVEGVSGNPPFKYVLTLKIRSLREADEGVSFARDHRLEIVLPQSYPRDAPICRMLTPVFHPNIAPHAVCIGDHWTAGESLALMILRVGEMLAYQSYNVKSPLNGRAAVWVEKNPHRLPVDRREVFMDLSAVPVAAESEVKTCANCSSQDGPFESCSQGHSLCRACTAHCETCGILLCLACGTAVCEACAPALCSNCGTRSGEIVVCGEGHAICDDCSTTCATCGRLLCLTCGEYPCRQCQPPPPPS